MDQTKNFQARIAESKDLDFIYQALRDAYLTEKILDRFALSKEDLGKNLFGGTPKAEVLLAEEKRTSLGLVLFSETNRNFTLFPSSGIYIHDLCVVQCYKRQGVGTYLMQEIKKIADDRKCCRVDWVLLNHNKEGKLFYESLEEAQEVDYITCMRMSIARDCEC